MKRVSLLASAAALALLSLGGCTKVPPGAVGIQVNYYGDDRGVDKTPVVTGMVWYNPITTSILNYPTWVQTAVWDQAVTPQSPLNEEISYNSKEGLMFTADISLSYSLIAADVPKFYVKFRSDRLDDFTHGFLHNIARDAFNEVSQSYTADELYGVKKEEMIGKVRDMVNRQTLQFGVKIEQFGYVGAPRPPNMVMTAINNKVAAIQNAIQKENELRSSEADAHKLVAKADGEAQANIKLSASLTPNLLQWRTLQLTEEAIHKWDGKRPMVEGSASGLLLTVNPQAATPQTASK